MSLTEVGSHLSIDNALRELFLEFPGFKPQEESNKLQERQEEISCSRDNLDSESTPSEITEPIRDVTSFLVEREARKVIVAHRFIKE